MKTITLWQPWASLIACGAKRIETRSWETSYRGELAIHAAKSTPTYVTRIISEPTFAGLLVEHLGTIQRNLFAEARLKQFPAGVVLAMCRLVDCIPAEDSAPSDQEHIFGDFRTGRYAWILEDIKPLAEPIPATGKQGLWEWNPALEIAEALRA
jgi:hypothetical protein